MERQFFDSTSILNQFKLDRNDYSILSYTLVVSPHDLPIGGLFFRRAKVWPERVFFSYFDFYLCREGLKGEIKVLIIIINTFLIVI